MYARPSLIILALLILSSCAAYETSGEFTRGRLALVRGDSHNALGYFQRIASAEPQYVSRNGPLWESIWTYLGRAHYQAGNFAAARDALAKGLAQHNNDHMGRLYLGLTYARLPAAPAKAAGFSVQDISFALREGVEAERVATLARERGVTFDLNKEAENQLRKAGADARLLDEIRKISAQSRGKSETQTARAAKELSAALTALRQDLDTFSANSPQGRFWDPGSVLRSQIGNGLTLLSGRELDWTKIIDNGEWLGQKFEEEIDRARQDESKSYRFDHSR